MGNTYHLPLVTITQRLTLKPLAETDAKRLYEYRSLDSVARFQGWTPKSPSEVAEYARAMRQREAAAAGHWYQVTLLLGPSTINQNLVIGDVAFCIDKETQKQAEIGIALDPAHQKRGYGLEAVLGLLEHLFSLYQLHRIHVSIDPRNTASLQLFERAGFRHEGHLKSSIWFKNEWCDDIIMGLLASEWHKRQQPPH